MSEIDIIEQNIVLQDALEAALSCGSVAEVLDALRRVGTEEAADLYLNHMGPDGGGGFEMSLHGRPIALVAEYLAGTFEKMGGKNYVQIEINHDRLGPLMLTMQRRNGETPGAVATREKARADTLEADKAKLTAEVERLRGALSQADRFILQCFERVSKPFPHWENHSFHGDHACAECWPGDDLLVEGFRCAYHAAKARAEMAEDGEEGHAVPRLPNDQPDENDCWYGVDRCTLPHCDCEQLTARTALSSTSQGEAK